MQTIQVGTSKPAFSWCPDIEGKALEQIQVILALPFIEHYSVMPDCHAGMENGAPIGSVIATRGELIPNFVGSDANCGVGAMRTNLTLSDLTMEARKLIHHSVSRSIPVGFSHNTDARRLFIEDKYAKEIDQLMVFFTEGTPIVKDRKEIASQLGTLGGG